MYKILVLSILISMSLVITNCDRVDNPGESPLNVTGTSPSDYDIEIDIGNGLVTQESGTTDTFTVVLSKAPSSTVTISTIQSTDPGEVIANPSSMTFTTADWDVPQTVTVTGQDDAVIDGYQTVTIELGTASGAEYDGMSAGTVGVTNLDDDSSDNTVVIVNDGLLTREDGSTDTFTVALSGTTAPTADVYINLINSDNTEIAVSATTLTFTPTEWNIAQTVTVTGQDDSLADGTQTVTIDLDVTSSTDASWNNLDAGEVTGFNVDDDAADIVIIDPDGLITGEDGATDTFTVVLASQPSENVGITITSSVEAEVIATPSPLTFYATTWNLPLTVTLTGQEDSGEVDGMATSVISFTVSTADTDYAAITPDSLTAYNLDNDEPHDVVILDNPAGYYTSEGGGQTTISLVLNQAPDANVQLPSITSSDENIVTVYPSSLEFTPTDWNIPHVITVTGVSDGEHGSGDTNCDVVLGNTTSSGDAEFDGISLGTIGIVNRDAVWLDDYTRSNDSYTYEPVSPASGGSATGTALSFTSADDDFAIVSFPFDFHFLGVPYNHIVVYIDGFASFNSAVYTADNEYNEKLFIAYSTEEHAHILAPWWDDFTIHAEEIAYEISGQVGSRVVTIEWYKADVTLSGEECLFQIKLYEDGNVIDFVYGAYTAGSNTSTASVGLKDDTAVAGSQVYVIEGIEGTDPFDYMISVLFTNEASITPAFLHSYDDFPSENDVIRFTPPW